MNLLRLLFLFSMLTSTANAQSEVKWLNQNLVPFSIDSANDEINELKKLKKYIGDSRIVLLGEQTHGDGATFETKVKLVKYLHQQMGFTVLAFESNQYNVEIAWEDVLQNKSPMSALQRSTHPIWGEAKEMQPLFEYLIEKSGGENPMQISGFDCQALGKYFRNDFKDDFIAYLEEKKINFADSVKQNSFFRLLDEILYNAEYQNIRNKA